MIIQVGTIDGASDRGNRSLGRTVGYLYGEEGVIYLTLPPLAAAHKVFILSLSLIFNNLLISQTEKLPRSTTALDGE